MKTRVIQDEPNDPETPPPSDTPESEISPQPPAAKAV